MADLSDDMTSWPKDPYALLGVARGTEARAIRQAYTALIRRFKPEKFPEQFRRVREAFDQVQMQESWRSIAPAASSTPEPSVESPELSPWSPIRPTIPDDNSLWDEACDGGHERVYRLLRTLVSQGSVPESVYLQLYWLRVAFPEIDWDVKPLDWLVQALSTGHEQGRVFELVRIELLYRRELCRDSGLIRALAGVRHMDVASRIFASRWQAAIKHDQWSLVVDEIPVARAQLFDSPHAAVNLFSWLVGVLAWNSEDHVQRAYRESKRELESVASGNRDFDYAMERIDFLGELVEQWRPLPASEFLLGEVRELLPVSWSGAAGEIRWKVFSLFEQIVGHISGSFQVLDRLSKAAPLVLAQVVSSAQQTYFPSRGGFRLQPDAIKAIYRQWPDRDLRGNVMRIDIAEFLAREQLSVDELINNVPYDEMTEHAKSVIAQLAVDNPLRLINLAQLTLAG